MRVAVAGMILAALPVIAFTAARHVTTTTCRAIDGDTIICDGEHIRLTAIDAPEMPGHCRRGRSCAPGDPYASQRALQAALRGPVTIHRIETDHYGRTVADVLVHGESLSCAQLATGHAVYWRRYDHGGMIQRECGL